MRGAQVWREGELPEKQGEWAGEKRSRLHQEGVAYCPDRLTINAEDRSPLVVPPSIAAAPTAAYVDRLGSICEPSRVLAPKDSREDLGNRAVQMLTRVRDMHDLMFGNG